MLGIMPWNFPSNQIARFPAPNLMLGNTIILKHSELVPRSALMVEQNHERCRDPGGGIQQIFATHAQIERIIADPRIQAVLTEKF
jgi:succinate-semialdehyde dehydrogenase / glutarate-semialdehyde dehydrogenase